MYLDMCVLLTCIYIYMQAGKMCDLYLTLGSLDTARRGTVWKGLFAVLLLHVEHGRDIDYLAGKLVEGFNNVCR